MYLRAWCQECGRDTQQRRSYSQNGTRPAADTFICLSCGYERLQLADVPDALRWVKSILIEYLDKTGTYGGAVLDFDELLARLTDEMWDVYNRWSPTGGVTFLSRGTWILRQRAANPYRHELGRTHDCSTCAGTGEASGEPCTVCGGDGTIRSARSKAVHVPLHELADEQFRDGEDGSASRRSDRLALALAGREEDPAYRSSPDLTRALQR